MIWRTLITASLLVATASLAGTQDYVDPAAAGWTQLSNEQSPATQPGWTIPMHSQKP
jgi:hypothetical protein